MENRLERCPFCGKVPFLQNQNHSDECSVQHINCVCGAGMMVVSERIPFHPDNPQPRQDFENRLIKKWNTRF